MILKKIFIKKKKMHIQEILIVFNIFMIEMLMKII